LANLKIWDVIIGLKVLGIDRATFPRYKPCAGGLTFPAVDLAGLSPDLYSEDLIKSCKITYKSRSPIQVSFDKPFMVTVLREQFDNLLLKEAEAAGMHVLQDVKVTSAESGGDLVQVRTSSGEYRSRFVLGCDGANSFIRKNVNSQSKRKFLPSIEMELELPSREMDTLRSEIILDLGLVREGYGWCFPKKNTVAIGCCGRFAGKKDMQTKLERLVTQIDPMNIGRVLEINTHPIPLYDSENRFARQRLLLAGDAAGLVDPFLGEGIYYALKSGTIAANWITEHFDSDPIDSSDYVACIHREMGKDLLLAKRLAYLVYRFPGLFFYLASRRPSVFTRFGECLSKPNSYQAFVAHMGKLLRWLFTGI